MRRVCDIPHDNTVPRLVELSRMEEFFLHMWDELDDATCACRHVATTALAEAAALSTPLLAWGSAIGVWVIAPQLRVNAALLAGSITFFDLYRRLLRIV